jgi:hypothetical protein
MGIRGKVIAMATLLLARALVVPASAATSDEIAKAIDKGVAYIYAQQKTGGHWEISDHRIGIEHNWEETQGDSFGGFSALSTYALLAAGESPQDKRVAAAIAFLKKADVIGIYSLGLRAQVWHLLAVTAKDKTELQKFVTGDAERILAGVNTQGDNRGLWDYGTGKGGRVDHSVSQYGILGLWALQEAGAKIDIRYWRIFDEVWRKDQFPDGGWAYNSTPTHKDDQPNPTASMTAAGIATLFITQDNTSSDIKEHRGNIFNANIENGLSWITKHFDQVRSNYTWYGVERIGVASGTKYFGTTDWFQAGANALIANQNPDGHWAVNSAGTDLTTTCFAVLFLSRGRAPVMMNKLHYDIADKTGKPVESDWNERPRDVANLTQWTGDQIESNLNWQLVNLKVSPEELRDAPILYLSGDQELNFTDADEQKLKTFVNEGGMILANADFTSSPFGESFQALGTKLFGYEFRELPPNSPIFSEQTHIKHSRTKVLAMSNGIRELMVLLDNGDPARIWQNPPSIPKSEPFELGANIFLYAIDKKGLETRGETNVVMPNPGIKNSRTIRLARLKYKGNWDPEPGGWTRLAAIFHNDLHADLEVKTISLGDGQLTAVPASTGPARPSTAEIRKLAFKRVPSDQVLATEGDQDKLNALLQPKIAQIEAEFAAQEAARLAASVPFRIAHLTGTTAFQLTDAQTDELRKFISIGGTLVIDSGGGSAQFSSSAEALLKTLLPDAEASMQLLPPDSPLYTLANEAIPTVAYRTFAHTVMGNLRSGRVIGITQKGRTAVYYSREDLSAGLVGQPTDGIVGYTPQTATAIMRNIILLSAPPPSPSAPPAVVPPSHSPTN